MTFAGTPHAILIRATIALAALGIACGQKPAASPRSSAAPSTGAVHGASASASGVTRVEYIHDPTLNNMPAVDVTVPAKWHFQGVLYQGGNCASLPFAVFRSTSPDGLSFVERLPALGWVWASGPMAKFMPKDCLPLHGPMSAQDFLKFLATTLKVDYVADEAVPAEETAKAQKEWRDADAAVAGNYAAMKVQPPKNTVELARAIVRFQNGTFAMKGELSASVTCTETVSPGMPGLSTYSPGHPVKMVTGPPSTIDKCTAGVRYAAAPEAQYAEVTRQWDKPGMGGRAEDAWQMAWVQRNSQQARQMMNQMNQAAAAQRQAQQQQFNHDQAVRQQMHEQFMATMQAGTDRSMARTQANMNARSTATSDWVDYALDRQTVRDPTTGQISKVSSSNTYTWLDSSGKVSYQTNDVNANPNGVLNGNWTRQQVVHGDGTGK